MSIFIFILTFSYFDNYISSGKFWSEEQSAIRELSESIQLKFSSETKDIQKGQLRRLEMRC